MPHNRHSNSKYKYDPKGATDKFRDDLRGKELNLAIDDLIDELISQIKVAIPQKATPRGVNPGLSGGGGGGWFKNWWQNIEKMAAVQSRRDARKAGAHVGNPDDLNPGAHQVWTPGGVAGAESVMPISLHNLLKETSHLIDETLNEIHGADGGDDPMSSYTGVNSWRGRLNNPVMRLGTYLRGEFKEKLKALINHFPQVKYTSPMIDQLSNWQKNRDASKAKNVPEDDPDVDDVDDLNSDSDGTEDEDTPSLADYAAKSALPNEPVKKSSTAYYPFKSLAHYKDSIEEAEKPREKVAIILRDKRWLDPNYRSDDEVKMVQAFYKAYLHTHPVLSAMDADEEETIKVMDEIKSAIERDLDNGIKPRSSNEMMDHVIHYQMKLKEQSIKNYTTQPRKRYARKLALEDRVVYYKNLLKD